MTVQELIDILQGVEDKSKPVVMFYFNDDSIREGLPVIEVKEYPQDVTLFDE